MQSGIYSIFCSANGKTYIGSAKNAGARWREHQDLLNREKHFNHNLQRAWLKYGADGFTFTVVEELGEYDKAIYFARENCWIDKLRADGQMLFNIARAEGGWGPETYLRKDEIIAKISKSVRTALSKPEVRQRMREAKLNVARTDSEKSKISAALINIPKTPTTRCRMAAAQQLRAATDNRMSENMAQIGRLNKGRTPTNAIKFIVDGIPYPSGKSAERALGITSRQLATLAKEGRARRE